MNAGARLLSKPTHHGERAWSIGAIGMTVGGKDAARLYASIKEAPRVNPEALGELCQARFRWRQTLPPHAGGARRVRS